MKRSRKGQEGRDKSQRGEGGIERERQIDEQTDGIEKGPGGGGGYLTAEGSCTVSVLAGNRLCPPAAVSGPDCQLLLNGVHSVPLSRCSPATGSYTSQDTHS